MKPSRSHAMKVTLTPGQAVTVFGWISPKLQLTWSDILNNENVTFRFLTERVNLSCAKLFQVQPDGQMWIRSKKAFLGDCPAMFDTWKLHPLRDFKCDLGDIIAAEWSAETMKRMEVDYDTLLGAGLTVDTMVLFKHITLAGWVTLGFQKKHAVCVHAELLGRIFNMNKNDILRALK